VAGPAAALVAAPAEAVAFEGLALCRLLLALGRVGEPVRALVTLAAWALESILYISFRP
jgi:hypothetical protein